MLLPRLAVGMFWAGMTVFGAGGVYGQTYPDQPIRLMASEIGGGSDSTARLLTPVLSANLGQQVIVENRAALIAIETVAKASPQGYALLIAGNPLWLLPLLQTVSFDPIRDFAPISMITTLPSLLVVHPSVPAKTVKELIALAKARPGQLNYASGPAGSANHLAAELFKALAGVNIVGVTYKGTGPALNAMLGGEMQLIFPNATALGPYVKTGRLRALAVTSSEPSALAPGLPTVAASGVPGYESVSIFGIFAPAGTPAPVINRLNQEIVRVMKQPDMKDKYFNAGSEVIGSSPQELAAKVKSEMARMGKVIKDAGIKIN